MYDPGEATSLNGAAGGRLRKQTQRWKRKREKVNKKSRSHTVLIQFKANREGDAHGTRREYRSRLGRANFMAAHASFLPGIILLSTSNYLAPFFY